MDFFESDRLPEVDGEEKGLDDLDVHETLFSGGLNFLPPLNTVGEVEEFRSELIPLRVSFNEGFTFFVSL